MIVVSFDTPELGNGVDDELLRAGSGRELC
jgi:hypothetical protein